VTDRYDTVPEWHRERLSRIRLQLLCSSAVNESSYVICNSGLRDALRFQFVAQCTHIFKGYVPLETLLLAAIVSFANIFHELALVEIQLMPSEPMVQPHFDSCRDALFACSVRLDNLRNI
jgi:hypothetical protein